MSITDFRGDYRWLSNFHMIDVEWQGLVYTSTEAAYQAAKTDDPEQRLEIQKAKTPGKARRLGQKVTMSPTWKAKERICKLATMKGITRKKFENSHLRDKLIITGRHHLVEGAPWGDTFWGVCEGEGENHLGRILMDIRAEIVKEQ